MLERADIVLATIPLLAVSGLAVRTLLGIVGIGTGMLAVPLAPVGYLAAFGVVVRELLWVPIRTDKSPGRT